MSGHSKWSTIKRAKAVTDAKRGAIFTKIGNLITIAAREKGGNPDTNFSLRMAMDKAKSANMPKDNIERAIKRGTGELGGEQIEELYYEGVGPAKAQFVVKVLTDNKNRSAASIRHIFTKYGGSLGTVMWNFRKHGLVRVSNDGLGQVNANLRINTPSFAPSSAIAMDSKKATAGKNAANYEYANKEAGDELELQLIEAGADDIIKEEEGITILTKIDDLQGVKKFLDEKGIKTESAEVEYIAKDEMELEGEDKEKVDKFIEELEENEDVVDYYTNVSL